MKMRSWSESSGAMLVPSTFTGWYRKTMMTSAKPMAISKSRVQTRISLRKECAVEGPGGAAITADEPGPEHSGIAEVGGSFSSGLSILGCHVFIARGLHAAPDLVSGCRPRLHQRKGCGGLDSAGAGDVAWTFGCGAGFAQVQGKENLQQNSPAAGSLGRDLRSSG